MADPRHVVLAMYDAYNHVSSQARRTLGDHDPRTEKLYAAAKAYVERQIESGSFAHAYRSLLLLEFYDRNSYSPSEIPSFPPPPWLNGAEDTDNQRCCTPDFAKKRRNLSISQEEEKSVDVSIQAWKNSVPPKADDLNDTQNMICRHLRQQYRCKECSPHSLCNHQRLKSQCHECEFTPEELSRSRRPRRLKRAKRAPSATEGT
jgi:hypothetical protein